MGLKYIANVFMNIFQLKERKTQPEFISDGCILYQSDGSSETIDHVEARDQPNCYTTTILQFRSSQDIYDFGQIKVFGEVFVVFIC
ncbi:hypothetical protein Bca101_031738 [Brassica carinata]